MADVQWIEEMFAAWNAHDGERAAAFFAPDGSWEDVSFGFRHEGRAPIIEMWSVGTPAFSSDAQFDLVSAVVDDRGYGIQWRWSGTHNDSGRRYDVRGASIGRLRDGLVVEHFDYWNPAHLSEQVGVVVE
jgi:uncharacterized protein (TIGR02246 family)